MQHKVPHRVYPKEIHQLIRIQHIALGLAHLAVSLQKPRMSEDLLRKRQIQRHQEDRPVDRMETDDILPDQMQIRRPVPLKLLRTLTAALIPNPGDIVRKRIQPYIDHMLRIKIHRNPPLERRPGHAEILKPRKQEIIHHLILARHRLDEFRMRIDMLDQTVRILAHLEEIRLLLRRLNLASAVRTLAVHQLRLCEEGLAGRTIHPLIIPLVNVSLVI